jgi:hypothetical protein
VGLKTKKYRVVWRNGGSISKYDSYHFRLSDQRILTVPCFDSLEDAIKELISAETEWNSVRLVTDCHVEYGIETPDGDVLWNATADPASHKE